MFNQVLILLLLCAIIAGANIDSDKCWMEAKMEVEPCKPYQILVHGKCRDKGCSKGFYRNNGTCFRCPSGCMSCLNENLCTHCYQSRSLSYGRCVRVCPRKSRSIVTWPSGVRTCIPKVQLTESKESVKELDFIASRNNPKALLDRSNSCYTSSWSPWSPCGSPSSPGIKTRTRALVPLTSDDTATACAGVAPIQYRLCLSFSSSVEDTIYSRCHVSEWMTWEQCDKTCSNKFRRRRRIIESIEALPNDDSSSSSMLRRKRSYLCPNLVESEPCPCYLEQIQKKEQCIYNNWSDWSECDVSCGEGQQSRMKHPRPNLEHCLPITESRPCCAKPCSDFCTAAKLGEWSKWSKCRGSCKDSVKYRVRTNIFPNILMFCDISMVYETKPCVSKRCKNMCQVTEWGTWSPCETGGTQYRFRSITSGNVGCPELVDSIPCTS